MGHEVHEQLHEHEHEHVHTHEHTHAHVHEDGEAHSHPHAHAHSHEHMHEHEHAHDHPHAHEHLHEAGHSHDHTHEHLHDAEHAHHHDHSAPEVSPKDELVALMKYMVGHNAAHIDELAELAKQLDTIGETNAYDRIQHAVELFRNGNEYLAEVLQDLQ